MHFIYKCVVVLALIGDTVNWNQPLRQIKSITCHKYTMKKYFEKIYPNYAEGTQPHHLSQICANQVSPLISYLWTF